MEDRTKDGGSGTPQDIEPEGIPSEEAFGTPTVYKTYPFAREWFDDAWKEARYKNGHRARRREIVFAVCCAEAYIVEWVLDVLKGDKGRISEYFDPSTHESVGNKWQNTPQRLKCKKYIEAVPQWQQGKAQDVMNEFKVLLRYRNGLVHASSSRPETSPQDEKERPFPSKDDLDGLKAGWPTTVVTNLIRELHKAVGTPAPEWLRDV